MTPKIDKRLNLVIPIERDTGTIYVHSMPLSRQAFEQYFIIISKAFAAIYSEGLSFIAGPRVAAMMLRTVAKGAGISDDDFNDGIMGEIRRLTNVLTLVDGTWQTIMFSDPRIATIFDEDEISEIEGAIVFFILCSAMHLKAMAAQTIENMAALWKGQAMYSSLMDFKASLTTPTPAEPITPKADLSFIPS